MNDRETTHQTLIALILTGPMAIKIVNHLTNL